MTLYQFSIDEEHRRDACMHAWEIDCMSRNDCMSRTCMSIDII